MKIYVMYGIGYKIIKNIAGRSIADRVSEYSGHNSRGRLQIPYPHQTHKVKLFKDLVNDDAIANKLIDAIGGQRLKLYKHLHKSFNKRRLQAYKVLIKNGFTNEEATDLLKKELTNKKGTS